MAGTKEKVPKIPAKTPPKRFSVKRAKEQVAASDKGFTVTFTQHDGVDMARPESITFYGPQSQQAAAGRTAAAFNLHATNRPSPTSDDATASFHADNVLEILAHCAKSWTLEDEEEADGAKKLTPVPVTVENARAVFMASPQWRNEAWDAFNARVADPFPGAA